MQSMDRPGGRKPLGRADLELRSWGPREEFSPLRVAQPCRELSHPIWGQQRHPARIFSQNRVSRASVRQPIHPPGARLSYPGRGSKLGHWQPQAYGKKNWVRKNYRWERSMLQVRGRVVGARDSLLVWSYCVAMGNDNTDNLPGIYYVPA